MTPLPFEELDYRHTPMGDLALRRRRVAALNDREVYEVVLGDAFLMSSLQTEVETALGKLGLAALQGRDSLSVVVGGLGLGYTAVAALEDERVAALVVVEAMEPVIDWHRQGLVPLGARLAGDPRCRLVQGDFFALAANPELGFDMAHEGHRFDAVLLDIDHAPDNWLHPSHAGFYQAGGLRRMSGHLKPGGVFAMWSDAAPDETFMVALREVFAEVRAEVVQFYNPLQQRQAESTVYVARLGG